MTRAISTDWQTPPTLGSSLGYGFLGTLSLGGAAGVVSAKNPNFIVCGLTILSNNTVRALEAINQELAQLRLYSQQTRYTVDYQLAQQGGVCTIVGNACITQITDESLNITAVINNIVRQLDDFKQGAREGGDWFEWLLGKTWGSYLMHGIIMMVSVFLVLCLGLKYQYFMQHDVGESRARRQCFIGTPCPLSSPEDPSKTSGRWALYVE